MIARTFVTVSDTLHVFASAERLQITQITLDFPIVTNWFYLPVTEMCQQGGLILLQASKKKKKKKKKNENYGSFILFQM